MPTFTRQLIDKSEKAFKIKLNNFTFDGHTKSIDLHKLPRLVMSIQVGFFLKSLLASTALMIKALPVKIEYINLEIGMI